MACSVKQHRVPAPPLRAAIAVMHLRPALCPSTGFRPLEEDKDKQASYCKDYAEAADKWLDTFVAGSPFVGGETPTIADYKMVPFFYSAIQPVMKDKIGLELSAKVHDYCNRFIAKVEAAQFMNSAGGYSIKEFCASKA